jgi:hypothetical protein
MSGSQTVSGREYKYARVRGFAPWTPGPERQALLDQVNGVIDEYREHLPMTNRQVFYRLVGQHGYAKTEQAYARLCNMLNRARRAGLVSFTAIRDDGTSSDRAGGWSSEASFYRSVRAWAEDFELDRRIGQDLHAELWVEASGMVPQASRVAHEYGIDVFSAGGFNSLTDKHATAQRLYRAGKPVVVLHVGDHDPSGLSILDALAADVTAFCDGLGMPGSVEFRRVAVTEDQIAEHSLPTAPQKATDVRGEHMSETVQAEALDPGTLAGIMRAACESVTDDDALADVLEQSRDISGRLVAWVDSADGGS